MSNYTDSAFNGDSNYDWKLGCPELNCFEIIVDVQWMHSRDFVKFALQEVIRKQITPLYKQSNYLRGDLCLTSLMVS